MNNCTFSGNVTSDPRFWPAEGEKPDMVNIRIAVNNRKNDPSSTLFLDCTAYRKAAVTLNTYVKKGQFLMVTGQLQPPKVKDDKVFQNLIVENFDLGPRKLSTGSDEVPAVNDLVLTGAGSSSSAALNEPDYDPFR